MAPGTASPSCTVQGDLTGPEAGSFADLEATSSSPLATETIICSPRLVSGGRLELATVGTCSVGGGHWSKPNWGIALQSLSSAGGSGTSVHMLLRGEWAGVSIVMSFVGASWDNLQLFSVTVTTLFKGFFEPILPLIAGEASLGLEPPLPALSCELTWDGGLLLLAVEWCISKMGPTHV